MAIIDISIKKFTSLRRGETLIILGSGPSINQLDQSFWDLCSETDTLAINHWVYHWFIPKYWSLEVVPRNIEAVTKAWKSHMQNQNAYKDVTWITNIGRYGKVIKFLQDLALQDIRLFHYEEQGIEYERWRSELISNNMFFNCNKIWTFNRAQASLFRMLSLFIQLPYKKYIFAGIDLNNCNYFWADKENIHARQSIDKISYDAAKQTKHMTNQSKKYGVSELIKQMKKYLYDPMGIELYVTNEDSALYPTCKLFTV